MMVKILDTTLREGEQTPGVYFDNHIKLAIAAMLDRIGIDFIEAGHPLVSTEICAAVRQIAKKGLNATVGAHSRSLKKDIDMALECGVGFIGIFYCVSDSRLDEVFRKDLDGAIAQITEMIMYVKKRNPDILVRFTPEDTVRSEFKNVVKAAVAACRAGADIISVADTTGYMVPGTKRSMFDYISSLKAEMKKNKASPKIAVHCHNDRGLALANALDAYRAGVDIIDATVLGIGERAGIVDLASLLTVLRADFNEKNYDLKALPELYKLVSRHAKIPVPVNFPVVGENAFTHCAGVHTQAAVRNPLHYQSLDPSLVGREPRIALGHMSGIASVKSSLAQIGLGVSDDSLLQRILEHVKLIGHTGRTVELEELKHIVEWCRGHK